jgi:phosphopentomutase
VSRVIARPFIGDPSRGQPFKRTYHRKDYSQLPFGRTFLDEIRAQGVKTVGIGKISAIYAGQGIETNYDTEGNTDGIRVLLKTLDAERAGLIFCNLIDFDMLYGHRRDVSGFAQALEEFDRAVPEIARRMTRKDLLILVADHGNDPTFRGTDHTREYIPVIAYSPAQTIPGPADLGSRESFADIGATIAHALLGAVPPGYPGDSFLPELGF